MKRISFLLIAALMLSMTFISCKKDESVKVNAITVEPASLSLTAGGSQTVKVTVLPENADNKSYKFSSNDPAVVTIDSNLTVKALKPGTAKLIFEAQDGSDVKGECNVTVGEADYTFIFYGCGGGDLDYSIVSELCEMFTDYGGDMRMAGIWKPSKANDTQNKLTAESLGGTRYFELRLKDNVNAEKLHKDIDALKKEKDYAKNYYGWNKLFLTDFVNEQYKGMGADFKLNEPSNISDAIKYVVSKCPAKKYILVTNNHGSGWSFSSDAPLTKCQLTDDNNNKIAISLDQLNEGVKNSGVKFELLYCDLCLMAQMENLVGFSENFPLCLASSETTTDSHIGKLAKRLIGFGDKSTDDLYLQCKEWIEKNEYKNDWATYSGMSVDKDSDTQNLGIYDLRKIGTLTDVIKQIASWCATSYNDNNHKWVINAAVLASNYATAPANLEREQGNLDYYNFQRNFYSKLGYGRKAIIDSLCSDKEKNVWETAKQKGALQVIIDNLGASKEPYIINEYLTNGTAFAHFVKNLVDYAKEKNISDKASIEVLYEQYMTALKGMCYIKCSHSDFTGMDAYVHTSPTVSLFSLNEKGYVGINNDNDYMKVAVIAYKDNMCKAEDLHMLFSGPKVSDVPLDVAKAALKNTKFDKNTGWSTFLEKLVFNPSILVSPIRTSAMYEQKAK